MNLPKSFANVVARHWPWVIAAWVLAALAVRGLAPPWDQVTRDGDLAYLPDEMTSVRAEALMSEAFPNRRTRSEIVLVVERRGAALTPADMAVADRLAARLAPGRIAELPIEKAWDRRTAVVGKKFVSPVSHQGQAALVVLRLAPEFMATQNMGILARVQDEMAAERRREPWPAGLEVGLSGSAAIGGDMLSSAAESVRTIDVMSVALVLLVLLLVYRSPALVLVPLVTMVVSVAVASNVVALLTVLSERLDWLDFKVFKTTKIFITVVLWGSGTDYCLFLISRYKEELERGRDRVGAMSESLHQVGPALVGSAMTTILGLSMMAFADFGKFRNSGPAIAICLAVALAASLTLAPALLRALGGAVFWPFGLVTDAARRDAVAAGRAWPREELRYRLWDSISRTIVARPAPIFCAVILLLAPLAWAGRQVPISYDLLQELRADRPSVVGTQMLRRHFGAGESGPITVLAHRPAGGLDQPEARRPLRDLTEWFYESPDVQSVRSLVEPLGDRPRRRGIATREDRERLAAQRHPETLDIFLAQSPELAGKVTRFDVVQRFDPFSAEAIEVVGRIDARLQALSRDPNSYWHGTQFELSGTSSGLRDLEAVTSSDQALIQRLVLVAVLAVLVGVLRRPGLCVFLMLTVLFSYYVTLGATELFFTWLYGPTFEGLDWKAPIFLFVILVATGVDYNVYLCARMVEEQRRAGPLEGLRRAATATGGIITSCGLIMAGTFLAMMFGSLRAMVELGFALTLGILLDTFVVRAVLVPSALAWYYRRLDRNEGRAEPEPRPARARPRAERHEIRQSASR